MTAAEKHRIRVQYRTAAKEILTDPGTGVVSGVLVEQGGREEIIRTKAVVMATGGFEADPELRRKYLGKNWEMAHVRGTPYNKGALLTHCLDALKARPIGHWQGCHSVAWDADTLADSGHRMLSNQYTKSGYPLGVMVNVRGERFVDEGEDFRNYTYARFGREILNQPQGAAFQVWDSKVQGLLRKEEYADDIVSKIWGDSIEELADGCARKGLQDKSKFIQTIQEYNNAVFAHRHENTSAVLNPSIKDGLSTQSSTLGLNPPKSNWALAVDESPFMAVKVTCGITFTFGGVAVHPQSAAVINDTTGEVVPGLFCAGEMLGGLFYDNYPGGSGLTSGAVFGRRAGRAAAELVLKEG